MLYRAAVRRGARTESRGGAGPIRALCQGKILHTRNRKSEIPLENATENPLDNSSNNPLDK